MYQEMIRAMERQSGEAFAETGSARSLWMHEWSKLVLQSLRAR